MINAWHKFKEQKPTHRGDFLCVDSDGIYRILTWEIKEGTGEAAWYTKNKRQFGHNRHVHRGPTKPRVVVLWMEFPELPEEYIKIEEIKEMENKIKELQKELEEKKQKIREGK